MGKRKHAPSTAHAQKADAVLADLVINSPTRRNNLRARPIKVADSDGEEEPADKAQQANGDARSLSSTLLASIVDFSFVLSLVFGGCCSNVWAYEYLLKIDARIGTALTFAQMLFITLTSLPSFLDIQWYTLPSLLLRHQAPIPYLKPRQVPLSQWALQVLVLTAGSLLNNWAFAFHVPLTIQIVFRSAGLAVSMLFGRLFLKKRYIATQIASVFIVTLGVMLATTSRPVPSSDSSSAIDEDHLAEYTTGVLMLTFSLFLTGMLGLLQEQTYTKYGPCWKEGIFYTHALSLPIFVFLVPQIQVGFDSLSASAPPFQSYTPTSALDYLTPFTPYLTLLANLVTQFICVSGVNQLTSRVSSVSTNLVLTTRKALSLLFSVWWFGNGWNAQLGWGAGMVFAGSILYAVVTNRNNDKAPKAIPKTKVDGKAKKGATDEVAGRSIKSKGKEKARGDAQDTIKVEGDATIKVEDNIGNGGVGVTRRRNGLRRENGGNVGNGVTADVRRPKEE